MARHRARLHTFIALMVLGLLVGCAPETDGEAPPPEPDPPAEEPATEAELGDPLQLDALPDLPDEGVAVAVDDALVFVGLDGEVHGHVPGAGFDAVRGLQHVPPGLVLVGDDDQGTVWLEPPTGTVWATHQGNPVIGDAIVLLDPHAGTPDAYVIHRPDEALAQWDRDARWWLSAGHRVVTWEDCPDDVEEAAVCPGRGHDLDMDGAFDLDPGCWVADALGDLTHLRVCTDYEAEPRSWLELALPGEEVRRYELPRAEGMPDDVPTIGHFLSAELRDDWILAQASMECEVRKAALLDVDSGALHPLLGEDEPLTLVSLALGWTEDGRGAVLVRDSECAEEPEDTGVWLVDPDGERNELVYPLPADATADAHLWRPVAGIDVAGRGPAGS